MALYQMLYIIIIIIIVPFKYINQYFTHKSKMVDIFFKLLANIILLVKPEQNIAIIKK